MTRKDYEKFARKVRSQVEAHRAYDDKTGVYQDRYAASLMMDVFEADNPKFSRELFLNACGLGEPALGETHRHKLGVLEPR